jgi:hypothetical protein
MANKDKWVMFKPGTVLFQRKYGKDDVRHTLTEEDCKVRYWVIHAPTWNHGSPANNPPTPDWHVNHDGEIWNIVDSANAFVSEVKVAPLKKEFTSFAVKDSVWEFERDWTFNGYVNLFAKGNQVVYTVPAGTRVRVVDNKMRMAWYRPDERCIVAEMAPGLEMFELLDYDKGKTFAYIPAREASAYLKLVTPGKAKTYWMIENEVGEPLVKKRYANLGNVKAAVRVRGGMVNEIDVSHWIGTANILGSEYFPTDKGVVAVQYDHATKVEVHREDLLEYMTMAKLSC